VLVHRDQQVARAGRPVGADELARPGRQLALGSSWRAQVVLEVEALVDAVGERKELGARRERQLEVVGVRVLDREAADDAQLVGRSSGCTSATEFECGSWIIRTSQSGLTSRSVASTRRSWLSRGGTSPVLAEADRLR
jgi:hypothetical protein